MKKQKSKSKNEKKQSKKIVTFNLSMTAEELLHVRDLLSIILPPDGSVRLSESLAASEKRQASESTLWTKVANLCLEANLPVGDDAPDFAVGAVEPLVLGVFQVENVKDDRGER